MISHNPDATIIAREILYSSIKENWDCHVENSYWCELPSSRNSTSTHHDAFFDYKSYNGVFYVGNITEDMVEYKGSKSMMEKFCNDKREQSKLIDFMSDSAVQDFLQFYRYSKNAFISAHQKHNLN